MKDLVILHLEDEPLDSELICATLENGEYRCNVTRVETRQDFVEQLESSRFDLVLADYSLPSFDGLSALDLVRKSNVEIPFILISGALGEDLASDSIKRGATDYVLKHRLDRLPHAVDRALREAEEKAERRRSDLKLAQSYQRERLINQFAQAIRVTQDPEQIKQEAVSALGKALKADRCYYVHYDFPNDTCDIEMVWSREGLSPLPKEERISDFAPNFYAEYRSGKTQTINDSRNFYKDAHFDKMTFHSMIRSPLGPEIATMTALVVGMEENARIWTLHEIMLVETIAAQTQAALDATQARLREHKIATILQEALQPPVPEDLPGLTVVSYMLPALDEASIGGDFYDVFALDKQRYAFVIGDVAGKGLAAAAQVSIARNMLRCLLYENQSVKRSTTILNSIVSTHALFTGFITLLAGIYDAAQQTFTYVSCGHEPGIVYRAQSKSVEWLETCGPPLTADDNADYKEIIISLHSNDVLLLYTDGLSEAGPNRREMLGTEGLTRIFTPLAAAGDAHCIAEQLVEQVNVVSNGIFRDDICLLVIEVIGRSQPGRPISP